MANLQTIINKRVWDGLTPQEQAALETWTYATWQRKLRDATLEGLEQVAKDRANPDITVIDWSFEERKKFREIAVEAWHAMAKKSPLAQEALDSNLAYMRKIGLLD